MKRSFMKNGMAILVITTATLTSVGTFAAGNATIKGNSAVVKVAMSDVKMSTVKTGAVTAQKPEMKPTTKPMEKSEPYVDIHWPTF